jgi:hypothetical protein
MGPEVRKMLRCAGMGDSEQLSKCSNIQLPRANFLDDAKAARMSQHGKHFSKFSTGNTSERHGFSVLVKVRRTGHMAMYRHIQTSVYQHYTPLCFHARQHGFNERFLNCATGTSL